jgi:hypothetical protein
MNGSITMTRARAFVAAAAAGLVGVTAGAAQADSVADFYKGKRMTMIVGYSPGGGYDTYTRLMSRHMAKYIPGKPDIIVRNMPGAGSIIAAQYIGSKAPKDGTVIGTFDRALPLNTMLGLIKIPFDPFKMTWLGSMSSFKDEAFMLVARTDSPYKSIKDLKDKSLQPIIFSATAPAHQDRCRLSRLQARGACRRPWRSPGPGPGAVVHPRDPAALDQGQEGSLPAADRPHQTAPGLSRSAHGARTCQEQGRSCADQPA